MVGTERAIKAAAAEGLPICLFISKVDRCTRSSALLTGCARSNCFVDRARQGSRTQLPCRRLFPAASVRWYRVCTFAMLGLLPGAGAAAIKH